MSEHTYTDFYRKVSAPWRAFKGGRTLLGRVDEGLRAVVASSYCIVLLWLLLEGDGRLLRAVIVPAVVFVLVSGLRAALNKPRPYEVCPIDALIHKETEGKSMPSRHMASATIIACTVWWVNPLSTIFAGTEARTTEMAEVATRTLGGVAHTGTPDSLVWAILWVLLCVVPCIAVGYVRVAGGVHFPRDIIAGATLALACAFMGFILIP